MTPLRVYISGAHSTGKTTLTRWVSSKYKLKMVNEVARTVLAESEIPLDLLRVDIDRTFNFQSEVFQRQLVAEADAGSRFVSDRTFDNLAYAASHTIGLSKILASAKLGEYVDGIKSNRSVVFFVRPHKELLAEDGVRERGDWEEVTRIDGMIRMLFELYDIDYVSIHSLSMSERVRTVKAVLNLLGEYPS